MARCFKSSKHTPQVSRVGWPERDTPSHLVFLEAYCRPPTIKERKRTQNKQQTSKGNEDVGGCSLLLVHLEGNPPKKTKTRRRSNILRSGAHIKRRNNKAITVLRIGAVERGTPPQNNLKGKRGTHPPRRKTATTTLRQATLRLPNLLGGLLELLWQNVRWQPERTNTPCPPSLTSLHPPSLQLPRQPLLPTLHPHLPSISSTPHVVRRSCAIFVFFGGFPAADGCKAGTQNSSGEHSLPWILPTQRFVRNGPKNWSKAKKGDSQALHLLRTDSAMQKWPECPDRKDATWVCEEVPPPNPS